MKHRLYKKKMNKKIIAFLIFICFQIVSISQCIANPEPLKDLTPLCYGFIVPLNKCDNWTIEDQINCKNRHLVNDLLREQISVYWVSTNITTYIRKINEEIEEEMFFEKGSFVIPFIGNDKQDTKLTAIIYDYNQSSEIENDKRKSPVFLLIQPLLNIKIYPLSEVKIAQFEGILTDSEPYWLELATKCGLLTFEFLDEKDIKEKKLNLNDFNIVMWPGGGMNSPSLVFNLEYKSGKITGIIYNVFKSILYKVNKEVRKFVAQGGGYIGSCGGCIAACCRIFLSNISDRQFDKLNIVDKYFLRKAYNTELPTIFNLAISDTFNVRSGFSGMGRLEAKILNDSHPVTFGLEQIVPDVHWGGPKFVYIGKNSQVIAQFYNTSISSWDETPSWVSSQFGKGRVVIFSTHPEYIDKIKNTVLSNSWYYTTCGELNKLNTNHTNNLSFIENIWETTANLTKETNETEKIFYEIKNSISININTMEDLILTLQRILYLIRNIAEEENVDLSKDKYFLEYDGLRDSTSFFNLFVKYLENTSITLSIFEKIYPLIENDKMFIQQIEILKSDLWWRINATRYMLSRSQEISKKYEDSLYKYSNTHNNTHLLKEFKKILVINNDFKLRTQARNAFQYLPQTYLNSLKLLRSSWYNYETRIVL